MHQDIMICVVMIYSLCYVCIISSPRIDGNSIIGIEECLQTCYQLTTWIDWGIRRHLAEMQVQTHAWMGEWNLLGSS